MIWWQVKPPKNNRPHPTCIRSVLDYLNGNMESATNDPLTIIPYEFPNVRKKKIIKIKKKKKIYCLINLK